MKKLCLLSGLLSLLFSGGQLFAQPTRAIYLTGWMPSKNRYFTRYVHHFDTSGRFRRLEAVSVEGSRYTYDYHFRNEDGPASLAYVTRNGRTQPVDTFIQSGHKLLCLSKWLEREYHFLDTERMSYKLTRIVRRNQVFLRDSTALTWDGDLLVRKEIFKWNAEKQALVLIFKEEYLDYDAMDNWTRLLYAGTPEAWESPYLNPLRSRTTNYLTGGRTVTERYFSYEYDLEGHTTQVITHLLLPGGTHFRERTAAIRYE